jgi:hypothetical protein
LRRLNVGAWQVRIAIQIKTWRASLDTSNSNLFDGIEADRAKPDGLSNGDSDQREYQKFRV